MNRSFIDTGGFKQLGGTLMHLHRVARIVARHLYNMLKHAVADSGSWEGPAIL